MIRLLIIVFALIVVLGAGAGGLIHFGIIPDFTGVLVAQEASEVVEEDVEVKRVDPIFYDLDAMMVPVIQDGELRRNISIVFRLEIHQDHEEEAKQRMSQLHDVYLRALYDLIPQQYETRETLDLRKIKDRLMVITERVVGKGVIKDILVLTVFER